MNLRKILVIVSGLAVVAAMLACATAPSTVYQGKLSNTPQSIMVGTPGVVITAEDNSFTLTSGNPVAVPFKVSDTTGMGLHVDSSDVISLYRTAYNLKGGPARKVLVNVPGLSKPLYGLLLLSRTFNDGYGPATRSYQIEVPQSYIDAAMGGRVSAVYERYGVSSAQKDYYDGAKSGSIDPKSWVLWLSDLPFDVGIGSK